MMQAQRQRNEEEQREGSEPFFKPTNMNSNSQEPQQNFFLFNSENNVRSESTTSSSLFQNDQSSVTTSASQHSRTNSPFLLLTPSLGRSATSSAPSSTVQQRQTQQPQSMQQTQQPQSMQQTQQKSSGTSVQGNDRLSSLHSRLHLEADKIRRWKVQTEIEQKQKERHLKEAEETIEHQRKAVVDLQLQNEMLSVKLQEEIENRADIVQKIETTRGMCNLLKDYTTKVEERLFTCERDRDELKVNEEIQMKGFKDLELKFKDLSLVHINELNNVKVQFEKEKEHFHENQNHLQSQVEESEKKVADLYQQYEEKETCIQHLNETIQHNKEKMSVLCEEKGCVQQSLKETVTTIAKQNVKLEESHQEIADMKQQNKTLLHIKTDQEKQIEGFKCARTELDIAIAELKQQLSELSSMKEGLESDVQKTNEALKNKQIELDQVIAGHQTTKERALKDMDEANALAMNLETEKNQLKCEVNALTEKLQEVIGNLQQMQTKLQTTEHALQKKEADMVSMKGELKEVLEREKSSYDKIDILKKEKKAESAENAHLAELLEYSRNEKQTLEQDLKGKNDEITQLQTSVQNLTSSAGTQGMKLETVFKEKNNLMKKINLLENSLKDQDASSFKLLEDEKKQNEMIKDELKELTDKYDTLESKRKSLQAQLTSKGKATKDLEKENKTLKSKCTSESKQKDALKEQLEEMKTDIEKKEEMLSNLQEETSNLKQETAEAVKTHNDAQTKYEHQMAEVSSTLNKYKADNGKIVAQKEKEIEQLKQKLEDSSLSAKTKQQELADEKKKIKDLKDKNAQSAKEMNSVEKEVDSQKREIDKLRKELEEKNSRIKDLEEEVIKAAEVVRVKSPARPPPAPMVSATPKVGRIPGPATPQICPIPAVPATPKIQPALPPQSIVRRTPSIHLRTPKTPSHTVKYATPSYTKTPNRSILRQATSSAKKRRVAFAGDYADDDTDSDSSTSQLMEIEIDEVDVHVEGARGDRKVPSQAVLPLRVKPSPRPPSVITLDENNSKSLKPVPRGKSAQLQRKHKIKDAEMTDLSGELDDQFKKLYPDSTETESLYPEKKSKAKKPSKIRQTPSKANALKNFRESPRTQTRKKKNKNQAAKSQEDLSWFESDAVFGFFDDDDNN